MFERLQIQRHLLTIGFALIILLMLVVISVGVNRMIDNNKLMHEVVTQNNVKLDLARNMYIAARERSVLLLTMLALDDPFERDELFLVMNEMATSFAVSRMALEQKKLDENELALLEKQKSLTMVVAPQQTEVADLLANDDIESARKLLFQEAMPGQEKVLASLKSLFDYEQKLAKQALAVASKTVDETIRFMYALALSVFLLSLLIAAHVIRKTRSDERQLVKARDTLELRVEKRTQELSHAYEDVKRHELEVEGKNRELVSLSNKLSKYLSPQVYDSIFSGKQEVRLASQRKKLTVLFTDIVGFTSKTDQMEPEDLTEILNQFLTEMSKIALQHGGTIDKYIGDAIMLFFGDPESLGIKEDALACVETAIEMQKRMHDLRKQWLANGLDSQIWCRIGIHTGYCTVGNFGSEDRMDYTIIGSTVNLASRLEHEAPAGGILISSDTRSLVEDKIKSEAMESVHIRGIAYPVDTFKVIDLIKNINKDEKSLQAECPKLKIEADVESMNKEEKDNAIIVLRGVLGRLES